MKCQLFSLLFSAISFFLLQANTASAQRYQDDFESYQLGSFPSAGGWSLPTGRTGAGSAFQYISSDRANSGTKSFHLESAPSLAVQVVRAITTVNDVISIEASINPTRSDTRNAGVGIVLVDTQAFVRFYPNGIIAAIGDGQGGQGVNLGTYSPNTWTKLRLELVRSTQTYSVYLNDTKVGTDIALFPLDANSTFPRNTTVISSSNNLASGGGSGAAVGTVVYFDDVSIDNSGYRMPLDGVPVVTQDFDCFNCGIGLGGRYHTGIDLDVAGNPPVLAAASGKIHSIYVTSSDTQNAWCDDSTDRMSELAAGDKQNRDLGNTVILEHADPNNSARSIFTQYSHLDCINRSIGHQFLDERSGQLTSSLISSGVALGNLGNSCADLRKCSIKWCDSDTAAADPDCGSHLHFEVKDFGELARLPAGAKDGNSKFIPGYEIELADSSGYSDPALFIYHDNILAGPNAFAQNSTGVPIDLLPMPGIQYAGTLFDPVPDKLAAGITVAITKSVSVDGAIWHRISLPILSNNSTLDPSKACTGTSNCDSTSPDGWVKGSSVIQFAPTPPPTPFPSSCEGGAQPVSAAIELYSAADDRAKIGAVLWDCAYSFESTVTNTSNSKKACGVWHEIYIGRTIGYKTQGNSLSTTDKVWICGD